MNVCVPGRVFTQANQRAESSCDGVWGGGCAVFIRAGPTPLSPRGWPGAVFTQGRRRRPQLPLPLRPAGRWFWEGPSTHPPVHLSLSTRLKRGSNCVSIERFQRSFCRFEILK